MVSLSPLTLLPFYKESPPVSAPPTFAGVSSSRWADLKDLFYDPVAVFDFVIQGTKNIIIIIMELPAHHKNLYEHFADWYLVEWYLRCSIGILAPLLYHQTWTKNPLHLSPFVTDWATTALKILLHLFTEWWCIKCNSGCGPCLFYNALYCVCRFKLNIFFIYVIELFYWQSEVKR